MKLYSYFRSSASYRVRIALGLKGLSYEQVPVNLLKGEQKTADYMRLNPQGLLPSLIDDGHTLTQSLAIMEYLEETHPAPALLPADARGRARVRALALAVACDIAPINNLGVLNYLKDQFKASDEQKNAWIQHWIGKGFASLEALLQSPQTGTFCHGNSPTIADCCLVPQLFNARRFGCDLSAYPKIVAIDEACGALPAFQKAHPGQQPDAA